MHSKRVIPLLLTVALFVGIVLYREGKRCVEDGSKNCKVDKESFQKVVPGQDYAKVLKSLGTKNLSDSTGKAHIHALCKECDSILLWDSDRYYQPELKSILVGFKSDTVIFKRYIHGKEKQLPEKLSEEIKRSRD